MPRKDIDYSKTVIYKIQHIEKEDLVYVGHTKSVLHTSLSRARHAHGSGFAGS